MAEFTGERVIPGQIDADLWNEHVARYAFAARRAAGRRVLDAGCGTGYGCAALAVAAGSVAGADVAAEAIQYARTHYGRPNTGFVQASCTALPFPDASFDLVISFEVIEHLGEWGALLSELRRVLAPGGECIISTPNRAYYAESRRRTGPNPFHFHEFDFEEFSARLGESFPFVSVFAENHIEGLSFQPVSQGAGVEAAVEDQGGGPAESHFLLAVCTLEPQAPGRVFVWVPRTANILREREQHIEALERELATKNDWLEQAQQEKHNIVEMFRSQTAELERSNRWASGLDEQLRAAKERIVQVQQELAEQQEAARRAVAGYEARIGELSEELRKRTEWALETERRLTAELEQRCAELEARANELADCVRLLDRAEATVIERTEWAQRLESQLRELEALIAAARTSRWVRLGRMLGLGPQLGRD